MYQRPYRNPITLTLAFFAVLAAAPPARANTYQFSFTASSLLSALSTAYGSAIDQNGYYAFWFQIESPNGENGCANVNGCAITSNQNTIQSNPQSSGADPWTQSNYFIDPSDSKYSTGSGIWVMYTKQQNQQYVTVATDANNTVYSLAGCTASNSTNCQYSDRGAYPINFGTYNGGLADVNNAFNTAGSFTFSYDVGNKTLQTTGSDYILQIVASAINTNPNGLAWGNTNQTIKTSTDQLYTLSNLVGPPSFTATPEPATWMPIAGGMAFLAAAVAWKRRRRQASIPTVVN